MNEVSPVNIQMNPQDLEGFAIRPEIECYDEVGNRITGTTDDLVRFDVTPPELLSVNVNGAALGSTIILNFAENQLPLVFSGVTDPGATVEILESTGQPVPGATAVAAGRETVQGQEGTGEFSISASTSIPANSQQRYKIRMVDVAGNTATNSYYISNHPPNRYYSRLFLGSSESARVLVYYTNVQQGSYGRITLYENGQAADYEDILVTADYSSSFFDFNVQNFWYQITPSLSSESDVVTISRDEDLTKFGLGWEVLSELTASAGTGVRVVAVEDAVDQDGYAVGYNLIFDGTVSATQGEPIALMTNAAISLHTELYLFNGYQTLEETFGVLYS